MNNSSTILVAGATGFLGSEICRQLTESHRKVKGLVRASSDSDKVERLKEWGVETVIGDLKDPASLINALTGVSAVISTVSSTLSRQPGDSIETVDDEGQLNLIHAAKGAGVEHFIFISFCPMRTEFPLQTAKRKVEHHLTESGMPYTILQPTCFMEVWLGPALGFDYANAKATIYGEGTSRLSWIAIQDVAFFAVASLQNSEARNKTFELGGPEARSPMEVIKKFETMQGRRFEVQHVPEDVIRAQKENAPDPLSESFAALMLTVAHGSVIDMEPVLHIFPTQLKSVDDYAAKVSAMEGVKN